MLPSIPILARPLRRRAGPSRLSGFPNSSPRLPPSDLPAPSPPPGSASPPGPASDPKILGWNRSSRRSRSLPPLAATTFLRKHPLQASVRFATCSSVTSWQASPARSATVRPFAALLGTFPSRAALTCSCEPARPAAVRRKSLPAPLAGFALKILRPIRSGVLGKPNPHETNSTSSPCRRRSEVPSCPCRPPLRASGRTGPLPPDHPNKMTPFPSRAKHNRQGDACG